MSEPYVFSSAIKHNFKVDLSTKVKSTIRFAFYDLRNLKRLFNIQIFKHLGQKMTIVTMVLLKYETSNDLCFIGNIGQYKIQIILYEIFNVHLCLARYTTLNLTLILSFLSPSFRNKTVLNTIF